MYETLSMKIKPLRNPPSAHLEMLNLQAALQKNSIIALNHFLSERGGVGILRIQETGQGSARSGDTMDSIFFVAQLTLLINNGLIFSCYLVASQSLQTEVDSW